MVWQRGGELLESPGRNLECVDAGGGKTTEVKRCLVSPNQYGCYEKTDRSCKPNFLGVVMVTKEFQIFSHP